MGNLPFVTSFFFATVPAVRSANFLFREQPSK